MRARCIYPFWQKVIQRSCPVAASRTHSPTASRGRAAVVRVFVFVILGIQSILMNAIRHSYALRGVHQRQSTSSDWRKHLVLRVWRRAFGLKCAAPNVAERCQMFKGKHLAPNVHCQMRAPSFGANA